MPELRSGTRQARLRSKRLDDLQPSPQPIDQAENWVLPNQNRAGRRVGTGRGRGSNAAAVAKGPLATPARQGAAGRGRGVRLIDLDLEQPCEVIPEAAVGGAEDPGLIRVERVADKNLVMEGGGSAEKLIGADEEAGATPVPERVRAQLLFFLYFSPSESHWILFVIGLFPCLVGLVWRSIF